MGIYTQLFLNCRIRIDVPNDVEKILHYLFQSPRPDTPPPLPDHAFFKKPRWDLVGVGYSSDQDFSKLIPAEGASANFSKYQLITLFEFKSRDGEISAFLHWIKPYIDYGSEDHFLGFYHMDILEPVFIFYKNLESVIDTDL